ncbi:MAG: hypothetical protein OXH51_05855, partial [Gemmatimonadetes bacterium]|nr:hypothetical protein [Gemmatimonadota bacterium]
VGDTALETSVEVRLDPRVSISRGDLMARHAAMMDSYRLSGVVSDVRERMGEMREQLSQIDERVAAAAEAPEELSEAIKAFRENLEALQDEIGGGGFGGFGGGGGVAAGAFVWATIERASGDPNADQLWQIDRSWEELPPIIERLNELVTERLPALNAKVYAEGLRPEVGEAVAMPRRGG